jgi:putative transposase
VKSGGEFLAESGGPIRVKRVGQNPRNAHLSASTVHPDAAWVSQQARNIAIDLAGRSPALRFLVHDRDTKFVGPFDELFRSEGAKVILTPVRAPIANGYAARVIETARAECLGRS